MGSQLKMKYSGYSSNPLPTIRVGEVIADGKSSENWLVEKIWSSRAVGILGGPPKSFKTWLAVDLALSVASGTKALERFEVKEPGRVVFFGAEDDKELLKDRFQAVAEARGMNLENLEVLLIDVPVLRLDQSKDQLRLAHTLKLLRPRLLVLDPLVRLHGLEENSATEISRLLSFIRSLERDYGVAILIVHHSRKEQGSSQQPGQGLRGSSDLHAFGDSNLYIRRTRDGVLLSIEHRSAPAPEPIALELLSQPQPHLVAKDKSENPAAGEKDGFFEEVFYQLESSSSQLQIEDIRSRLRVRKQRVVDALKALVESGRVERLGEGYVIKQSFPPSSMEE
jgi:hypothetical protein